MNVLMRCAMLVIAGLVLAPAYGYVVQKGDTLTGIAQMYGTSYRKICAINRLPNCNKIRVGQELQTPGAEKLQPQAVEITPAAKEKTVLTSSESIRDWKRVGTSPILPSWVRKTWLGSEEVSLDYRQEMKLREQGLTVAQILEVKRLLKEKKYILAFRPVGYMWKSLGFASGAWGKTRNATGDSIPVFAVNPLFDGTQVDLALGCGNTGVNHVDISKPVPIVTREQEEKKIACQKVFAFWAQITENNRSGTARLACLFQVADKWQLGPTVGVGVSRFDDHAWIEMQNFVGGGVELRGKNIAGIDAIELVVMVGHGSAKGHTPDDLVEKVKSSGIDLQLAAQFRETFGISKETRVTVRFMPFASIPLTGKQADILWKGMVVKQENGRHLTIGATLRFEFQNPNLPFKPEITFGVWRISDIANPVGWKILAGFSTLDNVWRVGAGVQFPNPVAVFEMEYNPAWGWIVLGSYKAQAELQKGATSTCIELGTRCLPAQTTPAPVITTSAPAKSVAVAYTPTNTSPTKVSNPGTSYGWVNK